MKKKKRLLRRPDGVFSNVIPTVKEEFLLLLFFAGFLTVLLPGLISQNDRISCNKSSSWANDFSNFVSCRRKETFILQSGRLAYLVLPFLGGWLTHGEPQECWLIKICLFDSSSSSGSIFFFSQIPAPPTPTQPAD